MVSYMFSPLKIKICLKFNRFPCKNCLLKLRHLQAISCDADFGILDVLLHICRSFTDMPFQNTLIRNNLEWMKIWLKYVAILFWLVSLLSLVIQFISMYFWPIEALPIICQIFSYQFSKFCY